MTAMITANINGHAYPLRLGMLAMSRITKEFGGLQGLFDCLTSSDSEVSNKALCSLSFALIKNGEEVEKFEAETQPDRPELKSPEHIAAVLGYLESAQLFTAVQKVIEAETATTIAVEGDSKNVETTQE